MATANERLVGRVAEILNAREVVINLGHAQGISRGMRFAVLTDPVEIRDPETGIVLDTLEREKTRVEAVHVQDRISVCRTYRRVPKSRSAIDAARFLIDGGVPEPFAIDEGSVASLAPPYAMEYVKVGDRVLSLEDDEA